MDIQAPDTTPVTAAEVERTLWQKLWSKDFWLAGAELLDAYRLFPRTFVVAYGTYCLKLGLWVMALKDISTNQMAFVTVVTGLMTPILAFYMQSGRSWNGTSR